jgi:hypothetical protein
MRRGIALVSSLVIGLGLLGVPLLVPMSPSLAVIPAPNQLESDLPLPVPTRFFTENLGQVSDADVRFFGELDGVRVGFTESAILLKMVEPGKAPSQGRSTREYLASDPPTGRTERSRMGVLLRVAFEGSNAVRPEPQDELPHRSNYFLGSDASKWRTDVRNYGKVAYRDLYDGIDLIYGAAEDGVKYEFVVRPGADLARIDVVYEGIESLHVDDAGELVVNTAIGSLRDTAPYAYQGTGDEVECDFVLRSATSYGFDCRGWDTSRPLVIDPLVYATYLGGSSDDYGYSIAVDSSGSAYVTGPVASANFPMTPGAFNTSYNGGQDGYVAKLSPDGSALVYATYFGDVGLDQGNSIAVDAMGNAYVAGYTQSPNFPVTPTAFNTTYHGGGDAFAMKLSADGSSLIYSTFLGGGNQDVGSSIAVDSMGNAYVSGRTESSDFPTTSGAFSTSLAGTVDGFVAKLNAAGSDLVYSTFFDGTSNLRSIALDSTGNAYVAGTSAGGLPSTPGAFDTTFNGGLVDAFAAKLTADGSGVVYATYLGGFFIDYGFAIAVDLDGNAYVTGEARSPNFPTTSGAFDTALGGTIDVFVTKISADGSALAYSTFLGGSKWEEGYAITVDAFGNAYVFGESEGSGFPTTPNAFDPTWNGGGNDAFLTMMSRDGSTLLYSTFLGGSLGDYGRSVAVDPAGGAYVTGLTHSANFPTTAGAFNTSNSGGLDAFVAKLDLPIEVTIDTSPGGLQIQVDGGNFTSPYTFPCTRGSTFTVNAPSPQEVGATRYLFANWSDGGAQSHPINCDAPGAYTANFTIEHKMAVDTNPPGLQVEVDAVPYTALHTFWCPAGSSPWVNVPSPQEVGATRYLFANWSDGGAQSHPILCDAPRNYTANFTVEYEVIVDTSPVGLQVEVDGTPYAAPHTFWCPAGSSHTLYAPSPQVNASIRYAFDSWSDGDAQSRQILCDTAATYVASFVEDEDFVVTASPAQLAVEPGGSADFTITVTGLNGYSGPAVSLSVISPPTGLSAACSPPSVAPTGTCILTVDVAPGVVPGMYDLTVLGDNGTNAKSTTVSVQVFIPPDFTVSVVPTLESVEPGNGVEFTVTVTGLNAYAGPEVTLSLEGPPMGITGSCTPASVTPDGTCTLVVDVASSVISGTYELTIRGDNGTAVRTTKATLQVTAPTGDFQVQVSPAYVAVEAGREGTAIVTVTAQGGFSGEVVFAASGLPEGVVVSFSPSSVIGGGSSTVTFVVGDNASPGTYVIILNGTSSEASRTRSLQLEVLPVEGGPPQAEPLPWLWMLIPAIVLAVIAVLVALLAGRKRRRQAEPPPQQPRRRLPPPPPDD